MKKKSLRFKIISLFIILMVVNAGFMALTLYQSLKNELISRDNTLLVNRADQLAKLINSGIDIQTLPIYFQRMMDMQQDIIYITDAHNKILVDTNSDILFSNHLKTVDVQNIDLNAVTYWETTSGVPVSAISFTIESPIGALNVVIAKASFVRISMLSEYLSKIIVISLASILFMGILSFWLIKHGLSDIRFLSQITAKTDIHTLNQKINISRLPNELKSLGESLNIMRERLKNDFVKLTQLADDLAHELRTPINAIKVQNEIMLQHSRSAEEYESIIISNIEELDKLAKIIENVLFIARAENKNIIL
ncbi:MAG TPA: two-component sensor histidine kinase, partial [Proteus sp.]|nr:two-component sensor histidine kinase [Proteus sp. (in: enterobacteria)]